MYELRQTLVDLLLTLVQNIGSDEDEFVGCPIGKKNWVIFHQVWTHL